MLNFFRKIRQQYLKEDNIKRYFIYAIGEILLVMIGILLALQVNNWNGNRQNKKKEYALLTALNEEFKANKVQLDTVASYHEKSLKGCRYLTSIFPIDIKKNNLDSISKHLFNSVFNWTFNPSQGSINGIINTSSFDIISNNELRKILVSWQDQLIDFQEDELNAKNVVDTKLDPFFSEHFDFNFDFSDPRNNLEILETLTFEYLINLRLVALETIVSKNYGELEMLEKNIDRIIEITSMELRKRKYNKVPTRL